MKKHLAKRTNKVQASVPEYNKPPFFTGNIKMKVPILQHESFWKLNV